jgi:pimeloyl-ACP methyl ester carboxylesterase
MGTGELNVPHALSRNRTTPWKADTSGFVSSRIALGPHLVVADVFGHPTAPRVLLLHGIPGWRGNWRRVAQRLAADAHVVAPDLLGFGESGKPNGDFHASAQAEMVVALIRQLGGRPVHLVGFDFGGPTAVLAYGRAPELVASLTLAATNVFTDTKIPLALHLVRPPLVGDAFARALFGRLGLTMMWLTAVAQRRRFGFARYREMLRFAQGITSTRRVFQASLRDLRGLYAPVEATLPSIRVPCTVIWGDRDPFFPLAVGERTASQIPGATFVRLPGCGHFLPEEDPDGFAQAVTALVHGSSDGRPGGQGGSVANVG